MSESTAPLQLARFADGAWHDAPDEVAVEEPLEIRVEGETLAIVMRTPGHDRELAAGFLFTEGIIAQADDLFDITTCVDPGLAGKGNVVDVALRDPKSFDRSRHARGTVSSASCGVCGKQSIEGLLKKRGPVVSGLRVPASLLLSLPARLAQVQRGFQRTGGLHACALFDRHGELREVREDVGRHNALDKLIGRALFDGALPLGESILLLSGRVSFEMMQKAHAAGIPVVAAISAPTSLAVALARETGQTLVGFLREQSMNLYAGAPRFC